MGGRTKRGPVSALIWMRWSSPPAVGDILNRAPRPTVLVGGRKRLEAWAASCEMSGIGTSERNARDVACEETWAGRAVKRPMNEQNRLKQQVAEAVMSVQKDQLAVTCESITVDFHSNDLVVTLSGATCPAERHCAQDKDAQDLLARLYRELFDVVRPVLEGRIRDILGREVLRSALNIDTKSGSGAIVFTLAAEACCEGHGHALQDRRDSRRQ